MKPWPFDTEVDAEFRLYTRGNIGEVFPDVVTPLTFTLNARLLEHGWRQVYTDASIIDPSPHDFRIVGYFGGRAYLNLALLRRSVDLAPGTSVEELDHQFLDIGVELPPYETPDDPSYEARRGRVAWWILTRLQDPPVAPVEADRVMALEMRRRTAERRETAQDLSLVLHMRQVARRLEGLAYFHILSSMMASVAFGGLQQGLRERAGAQGDDLARRAVSGLENVDSAAPAMRMAELAGLDADALDKEFDTFLADHGFRGANEWELASPSWDVVPGVARRLIEQARGAAPKPDPVDTRQQAVAEIEGRFGNSWPELPILLPAAQHHVAGRERTRTTATLMVNEQRLDAHELARRFVERGLLESSGDVFLLSIDELEEASVTGSLPDVVGERRTQIEALRSRQAPLVIIDEVPPLDTWIPEEASGPGAPAPLVDSLPGIGGSPGRVSGTARVVLDPYASDLLAPGEVLVAPITDPGWTPLFLTASAVVVETGGELSHAVIIARELGIPAVVAAAGACRAICTGDVVEVDGSTGTVRIIERAAGGRQMASPDTELVPADERHHTAGPERAWSESYCFNLLDPVTGLGGATRMGIRPNEGTMDAIVFLYLPDGGLAVLHPEREQHENTDDLHVEGVRYEVLDPMKRWRITYRGLAFVLPDARLNLRPDAREHGRVAELDLELEFEAVMEPVGTSGRDAAGEPGWGHGVAEAHFEQAGRYRGRVALNDQKFDLDCRGHRDKSWGVRDWEAPLYWRWVSANFGDDISLAAAHIGTEGGDVQRGWIRRGDRTVKIEEVRVSSGLEADGFTHTRTVLDLRDEGGKWHRVEGDMLRVIPLPVEQAGRRTLVNEGLARWSYEGLEGYGISEYLHQIGEDGRPRVPVD